MHALLGENGAGKSTLMKVLAGVYKADEGHVFLEGSQCDPNTPLEAKHLGIVLIHQELSLVPEMSVAENIFLGSLPRRWPNRVDWAELKRRTADILTRLDSGLSPMDRVGELSIAKQQMVEIARALAVTPKVVVFDEPTASLTEHETEVLFGIIRNLKERMSPSSTSPTAWTRSSRYPTASRSCATARSAARWRRPRPTRTPSRG